MKRIQFAMKPTDHSAAATADAWVESREDPVEIEPEPEHEPMKRLTIDVPVSLHRAIKTQCAMRGTKIAEEIRALLTRNFTNL